MHNSQADHGTSVTTSAGERYSYHLYGLQVSSEIDLGELPPGLAGAQADVEIVRATLPSLPEGHLWRAAAPNDILFDFPAIARLRVVGERRIEVDTDQDGRAALRWRLLGPAFGALLHQRKVPLLHATAIRIGGRVIGIVGGSGAGKSTLAAALLKRGHGLVIDDVCALTIDGDRVWVAPGSGRFRLLEDARIALGMMQGERLTPAGNKFELVAEAADAMPAPLTALVELAVSETVCVDRIDPSARLALILRHTYGRELLADMQLLATNLAQCSALALALPAHRLSRPLRFDAMDVVIDSLENLVISTDA